MVFSIIMLVCLIVCVGIDYLSLKRIERNGALLGVTLPQNAAELPEVQDIVQRYLRRLRTICLLCAAVSVGLFFRAQFAVLCHGLGLFLFRKSGPAVSALSVGEPRSAKTAGCPRLACRARGRRMEIRSALL